MATGRKVAGADVAPKPAAFFAATVIRYVTPAVSTPESDEYGLLLKVSNDTGHPLAPTVYVTRYEKTASRVSGSDHSSWTTSDHWVTDRAAGADGRPIGVGTKPGEAPNFRSKDVIWGLLLSA
jgi:hypothetical protein